MDTRKFLLILTVVIAVYVTVSSATQSPTEEHDNKAVQLADESQIATSEKNADDTGSVEGKPKTKPKRKHHGKKNRNNHARPRSHGGRNRTRNHHKNHRHGSKDKSRQKNGSGTGTGTPLPHEDTSSSTSSLNTNANAGERENKRQERNHNNKKEKNNKNRSRNREGRNRNHNHGERDENLPSTHPVQNDASSSSSTSINDPAHPESIYQAQNYNHNLVGHSTKTTVKHEPTKATGSTNSN